MKKSLIILLLICFPATAKPPAGNNYSAELKRMTEYVEFLKYKAFFDKLAFIESSNVWDTINQIGAIGKYQFLTSTLSDLGVCITPEQFRQNPALFGPEKQDSIIMVHTLRNERQLAGIIRLHPEDKFQILAVAHLAGVQGAKNYYNQGTDLADGNGTKISEYLKMFQ